MSGFLGQVRALPANAFVRSQPDPTYADGDDSTWTTIDWPSLTRSVTVLGRRVNVVDTGGSGPPLLFVHGLGGLWQNWLLNIPAFMDRFRVDRARPAGIRQVRDAGGPDLDPGVGAGDRRALRPVWRSRGPIVVGNSMGGFIGAELALAFPTRVSKLVLISAAGISAENMWREPVMAVGRLMAVGAARTGVRQLPVVNRPRLRRAALQLVIRYPEKLSVPLASELVVGAGSHGFVGGLDAVLGYSFRDRLPEIEVPTLIVWGRNDILIPVEDAYEFERLIGSNARLEIFDDTGHLAMLERPSRFNGLLDEFIAEWLSPSRRSPQLVTGVRAGAAA